MALISADNYGNLESVSVTSGQLRVPKKFFNVHISGDRRGKANAGYYQCPVSMGDDGNGDYFILNQDNVYFIPLYMKQYWVKYEKVTDKNGHQKDNAVDFGWDDKVKKPEGSKTEYIIAGYLWDTEKKNIVKHSKDLDDNNIKAGEPVLIYFKCKGMKCDCAYQLIKRVNEAAKNLQPLSDNPVFEQNMINPRRFLIKASIATRRLDAYNKNYSVFDFTPETRLPDDFVLKVLEAANTKFFDDFNKQFDQTEYVQSFGNKQTDSTSETVVDVSKPPTVEDTSVPDLSDDRNPGDDFNIDILG